MANFDQNRMQTGLGARDAAIDQGLRSYMLSVYNYMAGGLAITGVVAFLAFSLAVVVMLAPLGLVFFLSARISSMSVAAAQISFWVFAGLMGLSLSSIFLLYTQNSITQVFFVTAAAFGGLSLYGYTTKRDLSAMGSFLIMGVIGILIASLVNIFLQSSALQFAVSVIGVLVFAGLTAYDTQRIKEMYFSGDALATASKKAIMGALALYLDFINMFMFLLQLFGNRR